MPRGLKRYQQTRHSHFLTFSCYHRQANFNSPEKYDLFVQCLEDMRRHFSMCVYGYVVMPEHVHLLVSEPERETLADAIHYLKLSFAKRLRGKETRFVPKSGERTWGTVNGRTTTRRSEGRPESRSFWQKRYYDRNVRDAEEFSIKLRYLHRNPVKRGLASDPAEWRWSSFRHYALREVGVVEIESQWTARDREGQQVGGSGRVFLNPG